MGPRGVGPELPSPSPTVNGPVNRSAEDKPLNPLGWEGGLQDSEPGLGRAVCPSHVTKGFFEETVSPHSGLPWTCGFPNSR